MSGEEIEKLSEGTCPDCGCTIFRPGPRGGAAQNMECVACLSRYNIVRHEGQFITAHRIESEADGGGTWREDMFPRVLE